MTGKYNEETSRDKFVCGDTIKALYNKSAQKCIVIGGEFQAFRKIDGRPEDFAYYVLELKNARKKDFKYWTVRTEDVFLTRVVLIEKTIKELGRNV